MTSDPRAALSTFVAALETHLELAAVRRGENDPAVVTAYNKVADAFVAYDDALLDAFGEVTPLDVYSEDDDDLDEDDLAEDAGGTGSAYFGLNDDEYDLDEDDSDEDEFDDDADDDDDDTDDADFDDADSGRG